MIIGRTSLTLIIYSYSTVMHSAINRKTIIILFAHIAHSTIATWVTYIAWSVICSYAINQVSSSQKSFLFFQIQLTLMKDFIIRIVDTVLPQSILQFDLHIGDV